MVKRIWGYLKTIVCYPVFLLHGCVLLIPLMLISLASSLSKRPYDIGIGPTPMINNVYFKMALERKGYKVETFAHSVYHITDKFDLIYTRDRHPIYSFFPVLFFIRSIFRYKCIYIYFNGFVLMNQFVLRRVEPILLRLACVKIVVMPYGADHQSYKKAKNLLMQNAFCNDYPVFYKTQQMRVERDVERWTRYADCVLAHQDCVDYLPYWDKVRWSLFGVDTDRIHPNNTGSVHECLRIFHAPNHRSVKGSEAVEKAIRELKEEGLEIEYVYAHGVSNEEIIELIHSADIVIDQLVMGAYSMFAMESLACGKPVICYIRPDLKEFYEAVGAVQVDELPFISANVLTIKKVLKELIRKKDELGEIGRKSREYVVKYHSLEALGNFFDVVNKEIGV